MNSEQTAVSDGSLVNLSVNIEYVRRDEIRLYFNDVLSTLSSGLWSWTGSTSSIAFTPAVPNGVTVKIKRVTDTSGMYNHFTDGAQFTAVALDQNFDQVLHAIEEVQEGGGGGGILPGDLIAANVAFTPAVTLSSTNVQAAIEEVAGDMPQPAINFPLAGGVGASVGTSSRFAREDHVHPGSGGGGAPGTSVALAYAYKRAVSLPADNPGDVTFNFVSGGITVPAGDALANGWTKSIPAGTNPLYVTVATASAPSGTDAIAASEWATPVLLVANGVDGLNGLNVATIYIYQRNGTGTAPTRPSVNTTYTFSPSGLVGLNNGWTTTVPAAAGGKYLYVSTATAVSNTNTDTITAAEWAVVQIMAQDGAQGTPGSNGSNGIAGQRGTIEVFQSGYTSWSNAGANSAISGAGYGGPFDRDTVTLYGSGYAEKRFYNAGSWLTIGAVVDGNLLVTGTVSAAKINGGTLTGVTIQIGSGHTINSRAFEVSSGGVVYVDNLFGGFFTGDNFYFPTIDAVSGASNNGSAKNGVTGAVGAANSNSGAKGVEGHNYNSNKVGYVGTSTHAVYAGVGAYGPFTGSHDFVASAADAAAFVVGDIVVDAELVGVADVGNTIFRVERSTAAAQLGAVGVVETVHGSLQDYQPAGLKVGVDITGPIMSEYWHANGDKKYGVMNAVGEGQINVCGQGGNILRGEFICTSDTPGKGMRQSSILLSSTTVARARVNVVFDSPDQVQLVPCIYVCG